MAVLNKHKDKIPADAIYIGRGSIWGNPFIIGKHGNRDEVCAQYSIWLKERIKVGAITPTQLASLHGKDLVCYCAPLACHGDTLTKAAAWAAGVLDKQQSLHH